MNYEVISETMHWVVDLSMCEVWDLGLIEYSKAWELQRKLHRQRIEGRISDILLLLEHPPTITVGKSGTIDNVLISREQLTQEGISLFFIDRGGDVTYHGPGQIVGYPILDLRKRGKDLHFYVHSLEEVILRTLRDFSVDASRDESHPGVWVDGKEIAAIGLIVRRWVSMHGFALNINTNLDHFTFINPCGYSDRRATSISKILGRKISMETVMERLISHFSGIFDIPMKLTTVRALRDEAGKSHLENREVDLAQIMEGQTLHGACPEADSSIVRPVQNDSK